MELTDLLSNYAFPTVVAVWFIYINSKQYAAILKRMIEAEEFIKTRLVEVIEKNTAAMNRCDK